MNIVNITVTVKEKENVESLVLYQKIYSTPYGIVYHWLTKSNSEYRLEVIIDEDDVSVNPAKIKKSMNILSDEWDIAEQMMLQLYKDNGLQFQKTKVNY